MSKLSKRSSCTCSKEQDISPFIHDNTLAVYVKPNSPRSGVVGWNAPKKELIVEIKAPPEGGKANVMLVKLLSRLTKKRLFFLKARPQSISF